MVMRGVRSIPGSWLGGVHAPTVIEQYHYRQPTYETHRISMASIELYIRPAESSNRWSIS